MELTAYALTGDAIEIRPAPVERDWMEASKDRWAYRCLPLNIANTYGWEILLPAGFKATWSGGREEEAVRVYPDAGTASLATAHFGLGVLTFHVKCLFRTPPGFDLLVQGPVNRPKDAIAPLSGIIETDWAPYTFTMNWKFTRPGTVVRFEKGEPFCHFLPIRRGEIEAFAPRILPLSANPELEAQHKRWSESRESFNAEQLPQGSHAGDWQKLYYRGVDADGNEVKSVDHRTRLKLKPFEK